MSRQTSKRPQRNAGAFMGPNAMVPVPMRTLSDEYSDRPIDPEDDAEDDGPAVPERPRRLRALVRWVLRRPASGG